ncbi:autoinducer synthase, partial [Rhizobium sp. LARHSG275]
IQAKPSMSGLRKHHQLYSIQGSTLLLEPEARNPLKPDATLHHLHYCEFMAKRDLQADRG